MGGPNAERPFYLNWHECVNIILNSCTADPPSRCCRPTVSGEHQGSAIRAYNTRSATDYRLLAVSSTPSGWNAGVGRGCSDGVARPPGAAVGVPLSLHLNAGLLSRFSSFYAAFDRQYDQRRGSEIER
jgi:hypothetical protein